MLFLVLLSNWLAMAMLGHPNAWVLLLKIVVKVLEQLTLSLLTVVIALAAFIGQYRLRFPYLSSLCLPLSLCAQIQNSGNEWRSDLIFDPVEVDNEGLYTCIITRESPMVTSSTTVTLTVESGES